MKRAVAGLAALSAALALTVPAAMGAGGTGASLCSSSPEIDFGELIGYASPGGLISIGAQSGDQAPGYNAEVNPGNVQVGEDQHPPVVSFVLPCNPNAEEDG